MNAAPVRASAAVLAAGLVVSACSGTGGQAASGVAARGGAGATTTTVATRGAHGRAAPTVAPAVVPTTRPAGPATFAGPDGVEARWVIDENRKPGTTAWHLSGTKGRP